MFPQPLNLHESSRPPTSPSLKPLNPPTFEDQFRWIVEVNELWMSPASWCFSSATPFEKHIASKWLQNVAVQNIYHIMCIRLCSPDLINTSSSRFPPFHCLSFFHKRSENFCAGSLVVDAKTCYALLQTRTNLKENTVIQRQFSMFYLTSNYA